MNIAELFVTIGLKGGSKTKKDLDGVGQGLVGVSKKGLAAFTALAGISYGLSQLTRNALNSGNGLTKFQNFTGQSLETLQKWQYIAQQSGVSAEEMAGSVQQLAGSLAEMRKTGQFSGEFLRISELTNIDPSKLNDTFYILEKFREFTRSGLPTDMVNNLLGSFVSPDVIQMLRTNNMTPDQVPKGAILSSGSSKNLQDFLVAVTNLQNKIENSFAKILADKNIGPRLIKLLDALIPALEKLTRAVLLTINDTLEFWTDPKTSVAQVFSDLFDPEILFGYENTKKSPSEHLDNLSKRMGFLATPPRPQGLYSVNGAGNKWQKPIEINQNIQVYGADKSVGKSLGSQAESGTSRALNKASNMILPKQPGSVN